MNMACDHANRPPWSAGNLLAPQFGREILEKEFRHPVIGSPGGQKVIVLVVRSHPEYSTYDSMHRLVAHNLRTNNTVVFAATVRLLACDISHYCPALRP